MSASLLVDSTCEHCLPSTIMGLIEPKLTLARVGKDKKAERTYVDLGYVGPELV